MKMKIHIYFLLVFLVLFSCTSNNYDESLIEIIEETSYILKEVNDEVVKGERELVDTWGGEFDTKYWYNSLGLIVTKKSYVLKDKTYYNYDNNWNLIEEVTSDLSGEYKIQKFMTYNNEGEILTEDYYNSMYPGNVTTTFIYYKGKLVEKIRINNHGDLVERSTFKYDGMNLVINLYCGLDIYSISTYKSDSNENIIEINEYFPGDSTSDKSQYKYDEYGNDIEDISEFQTFDYKSLSNYVYEYDKNNNWITKIEFDSLIPIRIVERKIVYFIDN